MGEVKKRTGWVLATGLMVVTGILTLVYFSDKSEVSCRLIGGKFTNPVQGCYDCFFGCDSPLRQLFDYIRRGFRPSYLG